MAASAGIETRIMTDGADHVLLGKERRRRGLDPPKILEEAVRRRKLVRGRVAQHGVKPAFCLAGEHSDPHIPASIEIDGVTIQHRQASGDVEPVDHDRNPRLPKRSCDVEGARYWFDCTPTNATSPKLP
jgi:hypothetical protein